MEKNFFNSLIILLILVINTNVISKESEETTDVFLTENSEINESLNSRCITLKILLVEFADIKHRTFPSDYTRKDFENLFFSENIYVSPNMFSPDGKEVWGSLRDYYYVISNKKLNIQGKIVNYNSIPENFNELSWIKLDKNKSYYHNYKGGEFRLEAKSKAQNFGLDITTNDSTFLVIIYAGHTYRGPAGEAANTLNPQAFFSLHEYIMGERFASFSPYESERPDAHFAHIGIHAHEFAHLLGIPDLNNKKFDLMSGGEYNGPDHECACPAPINPFHRKSLGWLSFTEITSDTVITPTYSLNNSQLIKIKDCNIGGNYFIIEYRKFNELMNLGNNTISDYNTHISNLNCEYGILVWRVYFNAVVGLIYADGNDDENYDGHIFPGNRNIKVLSPWSDNRIPYNGHLWYPNTKPSINCGMEIVSDSGENFLVKIFSNNPLDASPSKPRNLKVLRNNNNEIVLSWDENIETDVINNGCYKIYKCESDDSNPTAFEYITTINACNNGVPVNSWIDENFNSGIVNNVFYRITAIDNTGKESVPSEHVCIQIISSINSENNLNKGNEASQLQNFPNPFNILTTIYFSIPSTEFVSLKVYDSIGKDVTTLINEEKQVGEYEIEFNASGLASGIYLYKLHSGNTIIIKKMILLK